MLVYWDGTDMVPFHKPSTSSLVSGPEGPSMGSEAGIGKCVVQCTQHTMWLTIAWPASPLSCSGFDCKLAQAIKVVVAKTEIH